MFRVLSADEIFALKSGLPPEDKVFSLNNCDLDAPIQGYTYIHTQPRDKRDRQRYRQRHTYTHRQTERIQERQERSGYPNLMSTRLTPTRGQKEKNQTQ